MAQMKMLSERVVESLLLIVSALQRDTKRIPANRTLGLPDAPVNNESHDRLQHVPQNVTNTD